MSESDLPGGAWLQDPDRSQDYPGAVPSRAHEAGADVAGDAKEQAERVSSHAAEATRDVVDHASARAQDVAREARARAATLLEQASSALNSEAAVQQQRLASGLRGLSAELGVMGNAADSPGYASELVREGSQAAQRLAAWLEAREPRDVVHEVEGFARRRPGVFLVVAAGAGLVAGRLIRGANAPDPRSTTERLPENRRAPERRTDGGAEHVA